MWQVGRILTMDECQIKRGLVHGTCPGLVEGNEYMFRIKAVNIGEIEFKPFKKNLLRTLDFTHIQPYSIH